MGAFTCPSCEFDWPMIERFKTCPGCDRATNYNAFTQPNDAWEDACIDLMKEKLDPLSTDDKIALNRLDRFQRAGLDLARCIEFAYERHVDLGLFEALLKTGCPIETAARIVAPL